MSAPHTFITVAKNGCTLYRKSAVALALAVSAVCMQADAAPKIDKEYIDIGLQSGFINVQDFGSNAFIGAFVNVKASERFFLQLELFRSTIDITDVERRFNAGGTNLAGDDRDYQYYGIGLGFNLYQAEFFTLDNKADLASFYITGGVGETDFGDDAQFTINAGLGYQMALFSNVLLNVEYKSYLYDTALISEDDESAFNTKISAGISYLF